MSTKQSSSRREARMSGARLSHLPRASNYQRAANAVTNVIGYSHVTIASILDLILFNPLSWTDEFCSVPTALHYYSTRRRYPFSESRGSPTSIRHNNLSAFSLAKASKHLESLIPPCWSYRRSSQAAPLPKLSLVEVQTDLWESVSSPTSAALEL